MTEPKDTWTLIPAWALSNDELTLTDSVLIGLITGLSGNDEGVCYAGNRYLAKRCKCSDKNITRILAKLESMGLIGRNIIRGPDRQVEKRLLWIIPPPLQEITPPSTLEEVLQHTSDPSPSTLVIDRNTNGSIKEGECEGSHPLEDHFLKKGSNDDWEQLPQAVNCGRRPLVKYPDILLSNTELERILQVHNENGIASEPVFQKVQSKLKTKGACGESTSRIDANLWLTGWAMTEVSNEMRSANYLAKSGG